MPDDCIYYFAHTPAEEEVTFINGRNNTLTLWINVREVTGPAVG